VLLVCQHGRWFSLFHQGRGDELPNNRVTCTRDKDPAWFPKPWLTRRSRRAKAVTLLGAPQPISEGGNPEP